MMTKEFSLHYYNEEIKNLEKSLNNPEDKEIAASWIERQILNYKQKIQEIESNGFEKYLENEEKRKIDYLEKTLEEEKLKLNLEDLESGSQKIKEIEEELLNIKK